MDYLNVLLVVVEIACVAPFMLIGIRYILEFTMSLIKHFGVG